MRGIGLPELLGDLFGPTVLGFALLTQLGDLWFLALLTTLCYWLDGATPRIGPTLDRQRSAIVVALLFGAVTLVTALKPLLGLQRPPGAGVPPRPDLVPAILDGLYAWLSTGDGFGFPSGHALGTTLVFGGLAWAIRDGRPRRRFAVAAALVTAVSLSRLVLGLHYLVDVIAGTGLGLVYLAVVVYGLGTPRRAFGLASAVGVAGLLAAGVHYDLLVGTALAVGGTVAWLAAAGRIPAHTHSPRQARATALLGLGTAAPLLGLVGTVHLPLGLAALVGVVGGALVIVVPLLGHGVAKKIA